jgi:hypothetical protein
MPQPGLIPCLKAGGQGKGVTNPVNNAGNGMEFFFKYL